MIIEVYSKKDSNNLGILLLNLDINAPRSVAIIVANIEKIK